MSEILILILLLFQTLNLISASPPPGLDTFLSSLPLSDPLNANDSFLTLPSSLKKSLSRTLDPAFKLHVFVPIYVKLAGSFSTAAPDTLASFISAAISDEFFSVLGVIEYGKEIEAAGELKHALEAIKWGTDYFIKAHTHPNVLWAEVGDGGTDHYCWQRPEDMTTSRKAYKIDSENPGSDLAGETAAAMAAASIVFRKINPHYSHLLLHLAQQLFEFGDKYRGSYDTSIGDVKSYYASVSGYRDELLWAALWLQKATGEEEEEGNKYLEYVIDKAHCFGDWLGHYRVQLGR